MANKDNFVLISPKYLFTSCKTQSSGHISPPENWSQMYQDKKGGLFHHYHLSGLGKIGTQ